MFKNPRRGRKARNFTTNSRSQIVFRTDIFPKIVVGCPCFEAFLERLSLKTSLFRKHSMLQYFVHDLTQANFNKG